MICPYCNGTAVWVENKEIYGKNYGKSVMVWLCKPCNAYVGCHNNTRKPLGSIANKETREWRKKAHKIFDPIWKTKIIWNHPNGKVRREKAYGFLQRKLNYDVHIGESDINMCKEIIKCVRKELERIK